VTHPETARVVRVLQSVRGPSRSTNPYIGQLVDSLRATVADDGGRVQVAYFSWRLGLFGRYDVLHLHWPEVMLRRAGRSARVLAQLRFALLMARSSVLRTPLVRTVHNVRSHEAGGLLERALLAWCERRTTFWIRLNPDTPLPIPGPSRVIAHGDYRDWFARYQQPGSKAPDQVPAQILYFGLIRPYKGVGALLEAFAALEGPSASLRIAGLPSTPQLRSLVFEAARRDVRIEATLEYIDDAALAALLGAAQLVVLPYRDMHNSGALLLALSLNRPVLVPDSATTRAMAAEVGPGWVHCFDGPLRPAHLDAALQATRTPPPSAPDLSARTWSCSAAAHADVYRQVCPSPAGVPQRSR
jgi:beta-1,4-mannosyltransferase